MSQEQQYLDLLSKAILTGESSDDRTGTGTYSLFGETMRFDLSKGFPLFTTKKINFSNIVGEACWFLKGSTDLPSLRYYSDKPDDAHTIWSDDYEKFAGGYKSHYENLGHIYGKQWRALDADGLYHDQIKQLITDLKSVVNGDPTKARRLIVQSWNPYDHTVGDKKW